MENEEIASDDSNEYEEGDSGSDDVDYYQYYAMSLDDPPGLPKVCPQLKNDMDMLTQVLSPKALEFRSFDDINEMDIDIFVSTASLEKSVAEAWGLVYQEPVVVRLCLNQRLYLEANDIMKIEVLQKSCSSSVVLSQLKKIIETFCREQFSKLDNEAVQHAVSKTLPQTACGKDNSLAEIFQMGFRLEDAQAAFTVAEGDKQKAVELLLTGFRVESELYVQPHTPVTSDPKEIPSLERGFLLQLHDFVQQRMKTLNEFCPICDNKHDVTRQSMLKPVVCNRELCIFALETLGVSAGVTFIMNTQPEVTNLLILLTKAAVLSPRHEKILEPYPSVVNPLRPNQMALCSSRKDHETLKVVLRRLPKLHPKIASSEADIRKLLDSQHELCYPLVRWILSSNRSHIVLLPRDQQLNCINTPYQFLLRNSPPVQDEMFRAKKESHGSVFAFHGSPLENWHSIIRHGLIVASGTDKQLHGAAHGKGIYLSPSIQLSSSYCGNKVIGIKNLPQQGSTTKGTQQGSKAKGIEKTPELDEDGPLELPSDTQRMICIALCEVINDPRHLNKLSTGIWTCTLGENVCTRFFFLFDNPLPFQGAPCVESTADSFLKRIKKVLKNYD
ncbi:protein mono-ADP-ribosyltransferase PARP6 [Aplysia californica]|uniref:Poly [ADP-ribose] polymerase n=1 Tax=Aplysia californica TaxID=6500 RepID=A0ABM0JUZ7_APLCA|nr:protein mono-ADP-ribosyltransferase PARP6 [Aplysia californica]